MVERSEPQSLLPLPTAEFQILLALTGGERHGHAIKLEVASHSDGAVVMGPGTLYGAIKRMLDRELIEECDETPEPAEVDERRRYYRVTELGLEAAAAEARRMRQLVNVAHVKRLI